MIMSVIYVKVHIREKTWKLLFACICLLEICTCQQSLFGQLSLQGGPVTTYRWRYNSYYNPYNLQMAL